MEKKTIILQQWHGLIEDIEIPEGVKLIIRDYDLEDYDDEKLAQYEVLEDETGKYIEREFENQGEQEYLIKYTCPDCKTTWHDVYSCACDATCPKCGLKNITALTWTNINDLTGKGANDADV